MPIGPVRPRRTLRAPKARNVEAGLAVGYRRRLLAKSHRGARLSPQRRSQNGMKERHLNKLASLSSVKFATRLRAD